MNSFSSSATTSETCRPSANCRWRCQPSQPQRAVNQRLSPRFRYNRCSGGWLAEHPEPGRTFEQYLAAGPVRRGRALSTLYLCLLGDLDEAQQDVIERAREYLGLFFDVAVLVRRRVPKASGEEPTFQSAGRGVHAQQFQDLPGSIG